MKKILITGAAGYIGSVLTRQLLNNGYEVRGIDILNFGGESLVGIYNNPKFEFMYGDIRNTENLQRAIEGIDAVVHLAAIVGDPACAKQAAVAQETNWTASKLLFDMCAKSNSVKRFIFASTCSNYGKMKNTNYVHEESALNPVSLYAKLKVKFENYILTSSSNINLIPTALRFSTVYGLSPRIRFDLTVNEFTRELAFNKELIIFGEQFWRPYCHVEDLARSCVLVLESEQEKIDHKVFGVGDTDENYQKKMLADLLLKVFPNGKISYVHKNEDPRDYKVDFSKIKTELGFSTTKNVKDGIREIANILKDKLLADPFDKKYQNI